MSGTESEVAGWLIGVEGAADQRYAASEYASPSLARIRNVAAVVNDFVDGL